MNQKTKQKNKLTSLLVALCMVIAMLPSFTIDLTAFAAETASTDPSDDWEYSLNADGTATLTKYTGSAADVYIPSTVTDENGERISVTALGEGVFKGNTGINSATFGESITTIGASAFEGATNLVCIVSPETLTTISDRAFYGCTVFNSAILYDAVTNIGTDTFAECPSLTIWVNEGSVAHTYAVENSISYKIINPDATPETYVQDGVTYYIMNGEAYAIGYDGSVTELVIPAMVEGYPVVEVREAFRDNKTLVNIVLPESLKVIGKYSFYACTSLSNIVIPCNVQTIGEYAFSSCANMTNVYISDSVTNIGNYTFSSCSKLKSINIPRKITVLPPGMFEKCRALETIIIPDNIIEISGGAFSECNALKNIEIPQNVTSIGQTAFYKCNSLTSVTIPTTLTYLGTQAFRACQKLETVILENTNVSYRYAFEDCANLKTAILPDGLSEISAGMFSRCKNLININIPNSVTKIGSSAFDRCEALTKVVIPENVTKIENYAFQGCENLTSITLNYGLLSIGNNAFSTCNNLSEFNIPESVTTIGSNIFFATEGMQSIKIPKSVTSLQADSFFKNTVLIVKENSYAHTFAIDNNLLCFIENDSSEPCFYDVDGVTYYIFNGKAIAVDSDTDVTEVTVPETVQGYAVTELRRAFENCLTLTSITLPETITNIDDYSFANCEKLSQVNIPDSVNRIGTAAFSYCTSLSEIAIPNNVDVIESGAFGNCIALKKVAIPKSVTTIYSNSFPKTTVWLVIENSYAHIYAIENEILYLLWDGNSEVALYEIDGVSYMIDSDNAIIYDYDTSLSTTELVIPNEVGNVPVTKILEKVFYFATKLQKITLPDSMKVIEDYAFSYCRGLTEINLPEGITAIGNGAFDHTALSSIVIPDSVTTLGSSVFFECPNLVTASVGKNVPSLRATFQYCYALETVNVPEGVQSIDDYAFYNCRKLKHVTIPGSVNAINIYAFAGSGIESVELKEGITFIAFNAFQSCSNLTEVLFPDSLTEMMHSAFKGCVNLKKIRLSNSLKEVSGGSFYECINLESVIIPTSIESLSTNSFPSNTILCVYENSYAHNFAKDNNLLYFVLRETSNPEIAYGAGISGTVTLDGEPAAGATVELLYDDGVVKETVTTDENGAYSFTYAEVGAYTIRATSGSVSGTEKVSVKRMNAFDVFLSGETDIVLKGAYTVSGSVSPAAANVTLADADGNVIESVDVTTGTYSFANVPNGSYIVKAETESGSAVREVTVFNSNVTVENITIASQSVVIKGTAVLEKNGKHNSKIWVEVTLYDMDGNIVDSVKTEDDGSYSFAGVPLGDYAIVARTVEMENHEEKGYLKPNNYAGFAYVEAEVAGTYEVETIYLREGKKNKAGLSGKVTAHGEHQACEVTLRDIFGNESARSLTTEKNGKYEFCNVPDGIYVITAITESNGMGFTVVGVIDGMVFGETDIVVYKDEKVKERENTRHDRIPHCSGRDDAIKYRDKIAEEKRWYDGLSPKKKRHCSKEYIDWLMQLIEWITEYEREAPDGAIIHNGGQLFSGDELENDDAFTLTLEITDGSETAIDENGIQTDEQFVQQSIHDAAGDKTIAKYYNISLLKKDGKETHNIKSIARDTDTTGKVRITMDIPEEYRGHRHYHFVHVHNGEPQTLVDLDDNPDTITFEVDRFSTFALTYTDEVLSVDGEVEEEEEEETEQAENFGTRNACIRAMLNENTRCQVTLLSGIDGLGYRAVGFEVTVGETTRMLETKTVYTSVSALSAEGSRIKVTPDQFGGNSTYIFGSAIAFGEKFANETLTYRPYAIDFGGNYIYGKTSTISPIFKEVTE